MNTTCDVIRVISAWALFYQIYEREATLQTFTRQGGYDKNNAIGYIYGKCRIHGFWSLTCTRD